LASCEKLTEIKGKAMGLLDDVSEKSDSGLNAVGEKEGKAIIADEARLVLVEFYSDT